MAARLVWGDAALISHRAAAELWSFPGFEPNILEVTIPRDQQPRHVRGVIVHRSRALPIADRTIIDRIPVTTAARTLIDAASLTPQEMLEEALDDALRRGLVSVPRLRWRLSELGHSGRAGITAIRALVASYDGSSAVPESVFERRLLRAMTAGNLPKPVLQHRVKEDGRVVAIVDFAFPSVRVAIEADGYRWHSGRARWKRDLARRNVLTSLGWRVVHITWSDLTANREEMIRRIGIVVAEARNAELNEGRRGAGTP
jgi:very-short-patch-repair endonuclease